MPRTLHRFHQLAKSSIEGGATASAAAFRSPAQTFEPSSASGKLIFHVLAVLAQFERDVNSERTKAGLAAARARMGGPKMKTTPPQQDKLMRDLWDANNATAAEIAKQFGISVPTFFRRVKAKSLKRS